MNKGKNTHSNFSAWFFVGLLYLLALSACGQPGPLYLPNNKPPIYVEPEPVPETKVKEKNSGAQTLPEEPKPEKTE